MHRLAQHSKPSKALVTTQLLYFKAMCESHAVTFVFVHKFLIKLIIDSEVAYLKLNMLDMEFFYISSRQELMSFNSMPAFSSWFENQYLKGENRYEH